VRIDGARLQAWGKSLGGRISIDSTFDLLPSGAGTLMRWSAEVDAAGLFSGLGSQSLGSVAKLQADRALGRLARTLEPTRTT
jgi:carbon monoxide dehydrogenase subunit G